VALPIIPEVEFNFQVILHITIFAFLHVSAGSCFKSTVCYQNSLESAPIVMLSPWLKEKFFTKKV